MLVSSLSALLVLPTIVLVCEPAFLSARVASAPDAEAA
jgi:hypothetical protein